MEAGGGANNPEVDDRVCPSSPSPLLSLAAQWPLLPLALMVTYLVRMGWLQLCYNGSFPHSATLIMQK